MKLELKYNANKEGYELDSYLEIESELDAEALGYATMVLFMSAGFLTNYSKSIKPELHDRVQKGIKTAMMEASVNSTWPFDKTRIDI